MAPSVQNLYAATAQSHLRPGRVLVEGRPALDIVMPPGPAERDGWSPEQLYAAAVASCLHQALTIVAAEAGVDPAGSQVTASVELRSDGHHHYTFDSTVRVELPAAEGWLRDHVIEQAVRTCPIGGSVRLDRTGR